MPNRGYATLFEVDKELAAAFKADCEEFLDEFEKLNSYNFLDFAKVWRIKKFTYIFAGQTYALILKDYIENCFYIVKKFIVFPKSLQSQIGALFLLYGLYYKQPLRYWVKVRLTFEEFQKICELLDEMKSRGCLDPVYIFSKMKIEGAFLFVAQRKVLGPEDRFIKNFEIYYNDTFSVCKVQKVEHKFKELVSESEMLKELTTTNSNYQERLKKYAEQCKDLIPMESTIMTDLQAAHDGMRSKGQQLTEVQERAKSKSDIKNKAVTNKIPVYRATKPLKIFTSKICKPSGSGISKKSRKTE